MLRFKAIALSKDSSPEVKLLRCCARSQPDAFAIEQIREILRQEIAWGFLIKTGHKHGLLPLLYWNLYTTCRDSIPKIRLDHLRRLVYTQAGRSILMTRELLYLINQLEKNEIPAFPYKGPILAASLYGDLTLRQYSDLDLVVKQADVLRVREILINRGYRPERPMTKNRAAARLQSGHALHFIHDEQQILLDLHWRITPTNLAVPLDIEALWLRLEPASLSGSVVNNLSPEDLLLILCIHGSKPWHLWRRLGWICDVAELLRTYPNLDWKRILTHARQLRSERMLYLGLLLAERQLQARLPDHVKAEIEDDPVVRPLAAYIGRRLFSTTSDAFKSVDSRLCYLLLRERWQDELPYFLALARRSMIPNRKDQALVSLPPSLSFLYFVLRPIRLAKEYGRELLRLAR